MVFGRRPSRTIPCAPIAPDSLARGRTRATGSTGCPGLVFRASGTDFIGTVSNIFRPSDVAGVYGALVRLGADIGGAARAALDDEWLTESATRSVQSAP